MVTDNQKAFTLIEVVLSMAIILILAAALLTGGKYLKTRAERQLTQSAIEVIGTAMEQYYEQYKAFPFYNRDVLPAAGIPDPYVKSHLELDIAGTVSPNGLTLEEKAGNDQLVSYASSAALYYFLDKNMNSRQILDTIVPRLITNKDAMTGAILTINIGGTPVDLPRLIDAWGMSLRYEYMDGYSFPVIKSAGPDKQFGTEDDLTSQ